MFPDPFWLVENGVELVAAGTVLFMPGGAVLVLLLM
jgi:hypothetical protein